MNIRMFFIFWTPKLSLSPSMKKPYALKHQRGFTLLEVMVAVAIFALSGAAIVKSTAEHLNSVNLLKNMTFATWVANNQLTETSVRANVAWPPKNELKGKTEMVDKIWYWEQRVEKTPDDNLLQVTITVYENESLTSSITAVSTFMAKQ
jgi:general secretion pathway protein I